MPADYSNISATTARTIAAMVELGRDIPDEALLEAAQRITPPLLPSVLMGELEFQLDESRKQRGRRRFGAPTRQGLIARLSKIRRDDVPALFFEALINRLRKGRRNPATCWQVALKAILIGKIPRCSSGSCTGTSRH